MQLSWKRYSHQWLKQQGLSNPVPYFSCNWHCHSSLYLYIELSRSYIVHSHHCLQNKYEGWVSKSTTSDQYHVEAPDSDWYTPKTSVPIWRYALVNFSRACKLLDQDPLVSIDIDQACWFWQQKFLGIMEQCILRDPYQKWNVLPGVPNKLWMQFVSVFVEPNKLGTLNLWPNTSQQGISSAFCFQMNSLGLIHDMSVIRTLVLTPKKVLTLFKVAFRNQRQVTNK